MQYIEGIGLESSQLTSLHLVLHSLALLGNVGDFGAQSHQCREQHCQSQVLQPFSNTLNKVEVAPSQIDGVNLVQKGLVSQHLTYYLTRYLMCMLCMTL